MSNRSQPAKGPNLVPVFVAIVVIIGAALAVAVLQNKEDEAKANEPSSSAPKEDASRPNPFADIDNSPTGGAGTRQTLDDTAPPGLMDTPTFVGAKALADEAIVLVAEAEKARGTGDEDTFQKKGAIAKAKLETAFERIADWVLDIQTKYPNDRQVARIDRETKKWDKALRKVRMIR